MHQIATPGGDELALYADHYMKLGQEIADISTDQVASGTDTGTIFDTSIGFISSKHAYSICGNIYYSGAYPGAVLIVDPSNFYESIAESMEENPKKRASRINSRLVLRSGRHLWYPLNRLAFSIHDFRNAL
jgi:hypothetical protein